MPRKLKSALLSHQADLAHRASQARLIEHRKAKAASIRSRSTETPLKKSKSSSISAPSTSSTSNRPPTIPFDQNDTILLLGEANFSFALSLLDSPFAHPPHQICATSYDSEEVSFDKYPDAERNVRRLSERGVRVGFGVDAGMLEKSKSVGKGRRWSRVIFNFPHAGQSSTGNTGDVDKQLILSRL